MYEVGVHIADVSYFLTSETKLDEVAADRATSVYMVQKVCIGKIDREADVFTGKGSSVDQGD